MKGFVISWYFPPINSSEGLVTFKLLKNSKYKYDVFTQKDNEAWSYGSKENKLISSNINTIFSKSGDFNEWVNEGFDYFDKNHEKYDFIMSRSMAPESHMIALKIKEKYPNIKWIASFGDPISDNPYNYFYQRNNPYAVIGSGIHNIPFKHMLNPLRIVKSILWQILNKRYKLKYDLEKKKIKLQQSVLSKADIIILNNEYQKEHMLNTAKNKNKIDNKCVIIPHSFDKDFYNKKVLKNNNKIKFTYLGHLDSIRTPKNFLEAIKKLKNDDKNIKDKISIEFYGNLDDKDKLFIFENELFDIIKVKKPVTYLESLKIMQESDWLLHIDANLSNYINKNIFFAAKLADYLGSGSNIFGISMIEGASADILRKTNSVLTTFSTDEIYMNLKLILMGENNKKTTNNDLFDVKNVVIKYDEMIKKLINYFKE